MQPKDSMQRTVQPELLDALPESDDRAVRSRADLRRVNRLLGHGRLLHRLLVQAPEPVRCLVDLGVGDGTLLLSLARHLAPIWGRIRVVGVDRQDLITAETHRQLQALDWPLEMIRADVCECWEQLPHEDGMVIMANLFLHHFEVEQLRSLLRQSADRCVLFAACDPRRDLLTLGASRLLGMLGCNDITRHDALASTRAGFNGRDLSTLWPAEPGWVLREQSAGLFSHSFVAWRSEWRAKETFV
jgi:hypothetical protein